MATSYDICIVGGGIFGLWAAKYAADAGLKTVLVDKGTCGSGGSHGLLGALSPHLPDAMNEKKRFQLEALHELKALAAALKERTGIDTGYRQGGRLLPLRDEGFAARMQRCAGEAVHHWELGDQVYPFRVERAGPYDGWLNLERAPLGVAFDGLSASAVPRLVTAALKEAVRERVTIVEGFDFAQFDEQSGRVAARGGAEPLRADEVILAAGYQTYDLLQPLVGQTLGGGVKGHSVLFHVPGIEERPMLYDDGVYVVPHGGGLVAVGSSSEKTWERDDEVIEANCTPFVERAQNLCPPLRHGRIISRWAGVRPRSNRGEPIIGRLPGRKLHVFSGGFKISFGIAHRLARALIERITGEEEVTTLPASYELAAHLRERG